MCLRARGQWTASWVGAPGHGDGAGEPVSSWHRSGAVPWPCCIPAPRLASRISTSFSRSWLRGQPGCCCFRWWVQTFQPGCSCPADSAGARGPPRGLLRPLPPGAGVPAATAPPGQGVCSPLRGLALRGRRAKGGDVEPWCWWWWSAVRGSRPIYTQIPRAPWCPQSSVQRPPLGTASAGAGTASAGAGRPGRLPDAGAKIVPSA